MPSVVKQITQTTGFSSLLTNNDADAIFQLDKVSINTYFVPTLQITKKIVNINGTPIGLDYSVGIHSLMTCTQNGLIYMWDIRDRHLNVSGCIVLFILLIFLAWMWYIFIKMKAA